MMEGRLSGLKVFKKHIATLKGKLTRLEKKIYETEGRLLKTRRYSDEQLTAEASRLDSFAQVLEANLRAWAATGTLDNAEQVEVALVLGGCVCGFKNSRTASNIEERRFGNGSVNQSQPFSLRLAQRWS